jgi:hypothetical protein
VAVGALPEWGFTRVSGAVYFHGVPLAESGDIGRAKETELPIFETLLKVGSITTRGLSPIAKKRGPRRSPLSAKDTRASLTRTLDVSICYSINPATSQRYGLMVLPMHD